ncbi:hypothetical protein PHYBLDRAFT_175850 [Phycomyces blakesleeanus NRRL 1555(-)]|uniref:Uncharacterized protein n=1 Tax=Phycomyces blakesleeanus (strain ATCC 8743b / DSM 1359 / FGSC 10004 / NBRC 33097 / NRRL 1555) TaxID=763407 RepID=A0A162TB79_PHYB8|nr:hypothetical protein PHYBLDRAFT_175850 [Phycomyces blakesleeanus NRRL 1555(-)]OAD65673.1 hypothetical protein PHYBLDRAFT_175850 [Phycomyces blakesleeanus NRRL 1555(-)]|eukprot:XP_018283713.1 hypothetical protein PHYBLDRAFT_175850 [Phycomyces blakesleeanus NRRL 1555(-)]
MSHLPGVLFFWKDPERPIDMILLQSDQSKSFGKEEHLCYWEIRLTGIAEDIILSFSLTLRFSSNQYSFTTWPKRQLDHVLITKVDKKQIDYLKLNLLIDKSLQENQVTILGRS